MSEPSAELPPKFADLSAFVDEWGKLTSQDERYLRRQELPMERLNAYYQTVAPRLPAIFDHLDQFAFGVALPEPEALLHRVVMAMTEVAHAVEVYGQPTIPHTPVGHSVPISLVQRF